MASSEQHPGTITFLDGNTDQIVDEVAASDVPPEVAFVEVDGQLQPVVRVVAFTSDDRRTIHQYGAAGELLNSTIQIRET